MELYAKPNGNAQVKIESNNYSDCYVRLESQTLPFYMKPTMFYSYFAMVLVIIIIQLTCAVKLINWNDRQLVSITRISLMSMTGCFVVTSYRAYNLVSSLTGYVPLPLFRNKSTTSPCSSPSCFFSSGS